MKDDLFNFDESLAGGFDTPTNDYEAQLKKARILCIRGRFEQALAICESILDEDMENMGAYIEILRVHTEDFTVFEGNDIEKDIHAIERLFPDIDNEEYVGFIQKRRKFLKEKENTSNNKTSNNTTPVAKNNKQANESKNENFNLESKAQISNSQSKNSKAISQKVVSLSMSVGAAQKIIEHQKNYTSSQIAEAKEVYEMYAKNGNSNALNNMGSYYESGIFGYPKDLKKAFEYYKKSAELDNSYGLGNLGLCYEYSKGCAKDLNKAFVNYKKAADLGYSRGMYRTGRCYRDGLGVEKDIEKAKKYFKMAADEGEDDAKAALNNLKDTPSMTAAEAQKIIENPSKYSSTKVNEANKALNALAEGGDVFANALLAYYYDTGSEGFPEDKELAFKHYKIAADMNDECSLYNLGIFYDEGIIVEEDKRKAFELFKKSADLGFDNAMYEVAMFYYEGTVIPQDLNKAYEYFKKAAEKGNSDAIYCLNFMGWNDI